MNNEFIPNQWELPVEHCASVFCGRNFYHIAQSTIKKCATSSGLCFVPWNYTAKLEEINRMVKEFGGPDAKIKTFSGYIDECWREAMEHSDAQLKTAARPSKSSK